MDDDADKKTSAVEALKQKSQRFREIHRELSDQLWSLTTESGLTADFFVETLNSNAVNLEAIRSVNSELLALEKSATAITDSAARASDKLQEAAVASSASQAAIESGDKALAMMDERFRSFVSLFQHLAEAVDRIDGTLKAIEDISELTNLLSLNAAIQAARAGIHGKGFKVVANEVKSLAEKSRNLTDQAAQILVELKTGMASSSSGLESFKAGKDELTRKMGASLEEQRRGTASMAGASEDMKEMSDSLKAQTQSVGHISSSMGKLTEAVNLLTESSALIKGNLNRQKSSAAAVLKIGGMLKGSINEMNRSIAEIDGSVPTENAVAIGHDVTYPPWVYIKEGHSAGIAIETARHLAKLEGLKVEFKPGQFSDALEDLFAGRIRILANVGWPNDFFSGKPVIPSVPFTRFKPTIFGHASGSERPASMSELKGKRVAAQKGSYVVDCLKGTGCETVITDNDLEAFAAVIWQRADFAITEKLVGAYLSREFFSGRLVPCIPAGGEMSVVFLFGSGDAALRDKIDARLRERETMALVEQLIARHG
jgi:methyl-accepting chemotaxis protein